MADDVTVDNGSGTDYVVATDDDGSGNQVQIVKLAQSANASRTPIAADSHGLYVTGEYVEDAAAPANPQGPMMMARRNDAPGGSATDTDGDVTVVACDPSGVLYTTFPSTPTVNVSGTVNVDTELIQYVEGDTDAAITGTAVLWEDTSDTLRPVSAAKPLPVNVVAGSGSATEYTEDTAAPSNPQGPALIARRADTPAAVTDTDGDILMLNGTNKGELYVKHLDAIPVTDNGGALTVDGAVTVTNATASNLKAEVVGTGTFAVQAASAGDVAHDGGDSGNPVKVGAVAIAHGSNPTAVAAADRTNVYANRAGIPFHIGGHPNVISTEYVATTAQTDDAIITVSTGSKIVVTEIEALLDKDCTVTPGVRIGFGTANVPTVPTDGNSVNGVVLSHPGLAAGSGVVRGNGSGIIAIGADNEDLRITNDAPTTGSLRVLVSYYTIES